MSCVNSKGCKNCFMVCMNYISCILDRHIYKHVQKVKIYEIICFFVLPCIQLSLAICPNIIRLIRAVRHGMRSVASVSDWVCW